VILVGDCIKSMRGLPDQSVHTCVTSPPYFGLRDYGHDGQIGLEPTPDEFVTKLVEVFREVRRVLRDDGTLWLNLGDSYASSGRTDRKESPGVGAKQEMKAPGRKLIWEAGGGHNFSWFIPDGNGGKIKPKDLMGIPWRVAFALQSDGWYLRQDIIWHKPNPMPESVTDRCTKAHEYIFLLSKSQRYYFDAEAIAEPAINAGKVVTNNNGKNGQISDFGVTRGGFMKPEGVTVKDTRNRRSVWTVTTKPFKGAHFATFPPNLIEPCVKAGCPEGGTVLDPFGGSGTTGLVAQTWSRKFILCELNPEYAQMAQNRIAAERGLFSEVSR
jgi:site-specific DNA-methyltransferase (adenine-specific)